MTHALLFDAIIFVEVIVLEIFPQRRTKDDGRQHPLTQEVAQRVRTIKRRSVYLEELFYA